MTTLSTLTDTELIALVDHCMVDDDLEEFTCETCGTVVTHKRLGRKPRKHCDCCKAEINRERWAAQCRKEKEANRAKALEAEGPFVLCAHDSEVYRAGAFYRWAYVVEDCATGIARMEDFTMEAR